MTRGTSLLDVLLLLRIDLLFVVLVPNTWNRASSPLRLLCFLGLVVVDEQLALLAIAVRHVAGDADDVERVGALVEDFVHLFERTACGLGEEEVGRGHHEGVDDGEDDVRVVLDVGKGRGRHPEGGSVG